MAKVTPATEIAEDLQVEQLDPAANPDLEASILARIAAAVDEALAAAAAGTADVLSVVPLVSPVRVRIVLEENDNIPPTGQFFGVNGRSYLVRPGEEVDVPMEVIGCLDDAVMETPVTDAGGNVEGYRKRLRFPYRVISRSL